MIAADDLTRAAHMIFRTRMEQVGVAPQDANQSIDKFWQHEWQREQDRYRAQARAAFLAVGLEVAGASGEDQG